MGRTTRKTMLYETNVEYGSWAMNHVLGCSHGCLYPCYAFLMAKRFGRVKTYEEWCAPVLVENTLELLDKEIPKLKNKIDTVQLCFTTDPFMYEYPEICQMSIDSIQKLNESDIPCVALTKGLLPKELSKLSKENTYGITLISLDETYREEHEPGAAPYKERIDALEYLHDNGYRTWVSMEPYPTPNILAQNLDEILQAISFTDRIIFGRTNYNKTVSSYKDHREFYNTCVQGVTSFCEKMDIDFHIKEGTLTEAAAS